ncbi:MAG: hypothetical protein NW207_12290 [Cytophagales bacterium]|nr:hypothetical protein [Cytophagales bacterium]
MMIKSLYQEANATENDIVNNTVNISDQFANNYKTTKLLCKMIDELDMQPDDRVVHACIKYASTNNLYD